MKEESFLEKIGDTENRKFPLVYKYVVTYYSEKTLEELNEEDIYLDDELKSRSKPIAFHKPISKVI